MKISQAFPSKYYKADDLDGKKQTKRISYCELERVGQNNDEVAPAGVSHMAKKLPKKHKTPPEPPDPLEAEVAKLLDLDAKYPWVLPSALRKVLDAAVGRTTNAKRK
jgi:hypothetical protein